MGKGRILGLVVFPDDFLQAENVVVVNQSIHLQDRNIRLEDSAPW